MFGLPGGVLGLPVRRGRRVPGRGQGTQRAARPRGGVRGRAQASRRSRPAISHFGRVVAWTGSRRRRSSGSTGPTSWCRTWRNSSTSGRTARSGGPMIKQSAYGTEPWRLVEKRLDLDLLAQSESIFALSNGHIGLRGNLDEGDPHGLPGSYLNSLYEVRPLPYAEAATAFPTPGRPSSTSPTARSSGCSWTTSLSTSGTARCTRTSASWTCGRAR